MGDRLCLERRILPSQWERQVGDTPHMRGEFSGASQLEKPAHQRVLALRKLKNLDASLSETLVDDGECPMKEVGRCQTLFERQRQVLPKAILEPLLRPNTTLVKNRFGLLISVVVAGPLGRIAVVCDVVG
jgi:hypothetical protein